VCPPHRSGIDAGTARLCRSPLELRARITRVDICRPNVLAGADNACGTMRCGGREVGLIAAGRENREGLELLSPLIYIKPGLAPRRDLIDGALGGCACPPNPM